MLTVKRLSAADARTMIEGAKKKADEIGVPMCIAIMDEGANLMAFERMDGGKVTSTIVAQEKAYTAAGARKATHDYNAACVPGNLVFGIHTTNGMSVVGGGLPVMVEGECVGGIGVSSGTPNQDMDVAQAGIDALLAALG